MSFFTNTDILNCIRTPEQMALPLEKTRHMKIHKIVLHIVLVLI